MAGSHEYPKWVHHPDHTSVVVPDAEAEAAQIAAWNVPEVPLLPAVAIVTTPAPDTYFVLETEPVVDEVVTPVTPPLNPLTQANRRPGWPKGKPRPQKRK